MPAAPLWEAKVAGVRAAGSIAQAAAGGSGGSSPRISARSGSSSCAHCQRCSAATRDSRSQAALLSVDGLDGVGGGRGCESAIVDARCCLAGRPDRARERLMSGVMRSRARTTGPAKAASRLASAEPVPPPSAVARRIVRPRRGRRWSRAGSTWPPPRQSRRGLPAPFARHRVSSSVASVPARRSWAAPRGQHLLDRQGQAVVLVGGWYVQSAAAIASGTALPMATPTPAHSSSSTSLRASPAASTSAASTSSRRQPGRHRSPSSTPAPCDLEEGRARRGGVEAGQARGLEARSAARRRSAWGAGR